MLERSNNNSKDRYTPKIVDFGIAKFSQGIGQQSITRTGEVFGSPIYMSPEQCLGEKVDHRCDIYSLACALFHTLTGCPPFVGDNALSTMILHRSKNPPTLKESSLGREYPQPLEELIAKCLEKDVNKRFQTMSELKSALTHCLDPRAKTGSTLVRASGQNSQSSPDNISNFSARKLMVGAGIFLALTGAVAIGVRLFNSDDTRWK